MKIYVGADHRGFELKARLVESLREEGKEAVDLTGSLLDPQDDYPDVAEAVARQVVLDPSSRGILICGSGAGMNIAANKIKGARATIGFSVRQIQAARGDDDVNILVLSSDFNSEEDAKGFARVFIETAFKGEDRHRRRLSKIERLENA